MAAGAWSFSGADSCGPPGGTAVAVDDVCFHLVRTLSERVGMLAAAATAVVVLMMVGLSRLSTGTGPPE